MMRPGARVADPDSTTLGTVLEFPAADPDGVVHIDMCVVRWDNGAIQILDTTDVWLATGGGARDTD